MPTDEIIMRFLLIVDEYLGNCKRRPDARLYAGEVVTISFLFALKRKRLNLSIAGLAD